MFSYGRFGLGLDRSSWMDHWELLCLGIETWRFLENSSTRYLASVALHCIGKGVWLDGPKVFWDVMTPILRFYWVVLDDWRFGWDNKTQEMCHPLG